MRVGAVTWLAGFSAQGWHPWKTEEGEEAQTPQSALQLQHATANGPAHLDAAALNAAALKRETQRTGVDAAIMRDVETRYTRTTSRSSVRKAAQPMGEHASGVTNVDLWALGTVLSPMRLIARRRCKATAPALAARSMANRYDHEGKYMALRMRMNASAEEWLSIYKQSGRASTAEVSKNRCIDLHSRRLDIRERAWVAWQGSRVVHSRSRLTRCPLRGAVRQCLSVTHCSVSCSFTRAAENGKIANTTMCKNPHLDVSDLNSPLRVTRFITARGWPDSGVPV